MMVWVYPEKTLEEFGAVRWEIEWQEVKPSARGQEDIDPDLDLIWHQRHYKTEGAAKREARKIVNAYRTAYGTVTVMKQVVDWFVEEDRVAEWADVGEPIYID